jgi:N-acetylglucosamine-6-sulfatase
MPRIRASTRSGFRLVPCLSIFVLLAAVLPAGGPVPAAARPPAAAPPPNIVFIMADDLDLRLGTLATLPHVKALLTDQGTSFSRYFVPLSLCCPSRASILLGQYPHNHQVYSNQPPEGGFGRFLQLGHEEATLGTALQGAGYRTALLGKYLNGYPESTDRTHVPPGWDEWDSPGGGDPYGEFNYRLNENGVLAAHGAAPQDYLTDVLAAKASAFIARSTAAGRPFFLYVAPYAPHKPATPAPRHQDLFPGARAPRTPSFDEADVSDKPSWLRRLAPLGPDDVQAIDDLYRLRLQSMQAVDEMVARLVWTLTRTGALANTYVVFTSDNGFHMGQHRMRSGKYTSYDEDIWLPLVVRGPGVPAGNVVADLASEVDLAPTFAELAGARLGAPTDGRSLVPLWRGARPARWRQAVLIEQFEPVPAPRRGEAGEDAGLLEPADDGDAAIARQPSYAGLRTAAYKYVEYWNHEREFYDLVADPYELRNLQAGMDRTFRARLSARLNAMVRCAGDACRALEAQPMPPAP